MRRAIGRLDPSRRSQDARRLAPGLLVCATVAMAATFLSEHYGAPVMLFALLIGIAFHFLSEDGPCGEGIAFASRTVLRMGVGLLGARITIEEVFDLGPAPLVLATAGVALTIGFGLVLARAMRFNASFGLLTGGSVGICGASAALALASVLPRGRKGVTEGDLIFTVVAVTTLSTLAMVVYPILVTSLGFGEIESGIFLGATIHDVAQVVGAGYSISQEAGDAATLTKLLRVAMLVPVVLAVTLLLARSGAGEGPRPGFPLFLVVFVVLLLVNSAGLVPAAAGEILADVSRWLLVTAIAALGMKTSLAQVARVGPRAMLLVVAETVWIALLCLLILRLV